MKTSFEGLMNRWDTTEERIHELEVRSFEIIQFGEQQEKCLLQVKILFICCGTGMSAA